MGEIPDFWLGSTSIIPTKHRSSLITFVTSKSAAFLSLDSVFCGRHGTSNSEGIIVTFHTLS